MAKNEKMAIDYQSKLSFYFVALVFTLLAASIQTATLSEMRVFNSIFELIGWAILLTSGISALLYLENVIIVYRHFDAVHDATGVEKIKPARQLKKLQKLGLMRYSLAKKCFLGGLIFIMFSRAFHGLYPAAAL